MFDYRTIAHTAPEMDLGHQKSAILGVYYAFLVLGGHVCLPVLIATLVLTRAITRRHPTLINLLVLWMMYATACLILLYSGEQSKGYPNYAVCLAQASMIYGSITGGEIATLCLVLQLWMEFRGQTFYRHSKLSTILLLLAPWTVFLFFMILALIIGLKDPSIVTNKWVFYCTVSSNFIVYTVSAMCLVTLVLILVFQGLVHRFLYKSSRAKAIDQSSLRLSLRVTIFTLFSLVSFIVGIIIAFEPAEPAVYVLISLLPLVTFLIFGTQKETLSLWFRVGRKPQRRVQLEPITFKTGTVQGSGYSHSDKDLDKPLPRTPQSSDENGSV